MNQSLQIQDLRTEMKVALKEKYITSLSIISKNLGKILNILTSEILQNLYSTILLK